MELSILLDYVLPSTSVLMKHCNGGWDFYKTDDDFLNEKSFMAQKASESFHSFMERLIIVLMEEEKNDDELLVATDYAIWKNETKNGLSEILMELEQGKISADHAEQNIIDLK